MKKQFGNVPVFLQGYAVHTQAFKDPVVLHQEACHPQRDMSGHPSGKFLLTY